MPQQIINIGTTANDGTGDTLRESQRKAQENFSELYINNTNLDSRVTDLELPDGIILLGTINQTGSAVTISANEFSVRTNQMVVFNTAFSGTIASATDLYSRVDIYEIDSNGIIYIKQGVEDIEVAKKPDVTVGRYEIGLVNINGATVAPATTTPSGSTYVVKNEFTFAKLSGSGAKAQFSLFSEVTNVRVLSASSIASITIDKKYLYAGKDHYVKNETGTTLIIKHNSGTGNYKYLFPNATDLVIQNNEIIHFKFRFDTGNTGFLDYVGVASSSDPSKQNKLVAGTNITINVTDPLNPVISASSSGGVALGETDTTAYRGDRGLTAYTHSQSAHAPSDAQKNSDITKAEIEAKLTGEIASHTHAVAGDYTADQITETATRVFQTPTQRTNNNATSPIQGQLDSKQATITAGTTAQYYRGDKTFQTLDKTAVGLANVDNTSDANKPVSSATQTALNLKANDNNVVHLNGTESITGTKTFTSGATNWDSATNNLLTFKIAGVSVGSLSFSTGFTQFFSSATGGYLFKNSLGSNSLTLSDSGTANFLSSATATSFIKSGATSGNILLAGGTDIPQSIFATSGSLGNYLPLTGGTLTGVLNGTSSSFSSSVTALGLNSLGSSNTELISATLTNTSTANNTTKENSLVFELTDTINTRKPVGTITAFLSDANAVGGGLIFKTRVSDAQVTALTLNPTGQATFSSSVTATSFVKTGAVANQLLKADGTTTVGYKVYTALLSQTGTSAPTATVLENTFGGAIVWSRYTVGTYRGTLTGAFPLNKTALINGSTQIEVSGTSTLNYNDVNSVSLKSFNSLAYQDTVLNGITIEIRVYN